MITKQRVGVQCPRGCKIKYYLRGNINKEDVEGERLEGYTVWIVKKEEEFANYCYRCGNHMTGIIEYMLPHVRRQCYFEGTSPEIRFVMGDYSVEWVNLGEGRDGEYDEDDPKDINLLRFDFKYKGETVSNGSYCTLMPAGTEDYILREALEKIMLEVREGCNGDACPKKKLEEMSWIAPGWFTIKNWSISFRSADELEFTHKDGKYFVMVREFIRDADTPWVVDLWRVEEGDENKHQSETTTMIHVISNPKSIEDGMDCAVSWMRAHPEVNEGDI